MGSRIKAATVGEFADNVLVSHRVEAEVAAPDELGCADSVTTPMPIAGIRPMGDRSENPSSRGDHRKWAHVVARERKALDPKPDLFCAGLRGHRPRFEGVDILTVNLKGHTDGR